MSAVEDAVESGLHAAGFISYEAAPAFEPSLVVHQPLRGLPLLSFGFYATREEVDPLEDPLAESTNDTPPADGAAASSGRYDLGPLTPSLTLEAYRERIRRIGELIAAGDTYQVNFTFRLRAEYHGDAAAFYADLRRAQRSAYCAYLPAGRFHLLSASPELFFRWRDGQIETRPMKGTRPRGRWTAEDEALASELQGSPKDRAENLMIVDLIRNDLGRVAEIGTVRVPELFEVERYPTVHQMTSTVVARTPPGTRFSDLCRVLFPSGSVTGAPKIRTSAIIRELEDSPRGVYTGAIGFLSPGPEAVFSVAIRTVMLDVAEGRAEIGVGSGIVADSDADDEYRECLRKGVFLRHREPDFRLLESLRLDADGEYPLLERHLRRLADSARFFSFAYDEPAVRRSLAELVAGTLGSIEAAATREAEARRSPGPAGAAIHKVRLLLARDGEVSVSAERIPERLPPARIALSALQVDTTDSLLFHKTTHRALFEHALALRSDLDDVVLSNGAGEITEATRANIVVELDGELVTPPIGAGLLPGVMRGLLLDEGRVTERVLRPSDLTAATRIWLVNAVRGWREARLFG